ncbi:hypothetical protein E2C01_010593 [Portunus trituberculatus]|uniref:Uncharacterized protein n=1 Tax=Portunus trituberculatus TaxID=210409 RepID=A0A5B7D8T3_PORTR|nr:hypothetical protein [Portunus trituberculatus]
MFQYAEVRHGGGDGVAAAGVRGQNEALIRMSDEEVARLNNVTASPSEESNSVRVMPGILLWPPAVLGNPDERGAPFVGGENVKNLK